MTDPVRAVASGGIVYNFGVPDQEVYPLPMEEFPRKQLTLISGATLERARVLAAAEDYLAVHPDLASHLITHEFEFADVQEAYDLAFGKPARRLKVNVRFADC